MSKALLYDATLCIGCKACEEACAKENGLPYDPAIARQEKTSALKYTVVLERQGTFMRRQCMHCAEPTCASVCPVGAFTKSPLGPVLYDEDKCIGCRYCMLACPFQAPTYEWDKRSPIVKKCTLCASRTLNGGQPACAEICPTGATKFGERDALLAEARERIQQGPGQYEAHIFGEHEVGGTSVLIIGKAPLAMFGYVPNLNTEPMPLLTWRVLRHVPDVGMMTMVLLGGIWWISHRREEVAAFEHAERAKELAERGKKEKTS
jgi:formate dehydrogenase iron-sulfur subunit